MLLSELNSELIALRAAIGSKADVEVKPAGDGLFMVSLSPDGDGWITVATEVALDDLVPYLRRLKGAFTAGINEWRIL